VLARQTSITWRIYASAGKRYRGVELVDSRGELALLYAPLFLESSEFLIILASLWTLRAHPRPCGVIAKVRCVR